MDCVDPVDVPKEASLVTWQFGLALAGLAISCMLMAIEDWRTRTISMWSIFPIVVMAPWLQSLGWFAILVVVYATCMVAVGLWIAHRGWWGEGDALALGVVALVPDLAVLGLAVATIAVVGYKLGRRPPTLSLFAQFWNHIEGVQGEMLPFATFLGLSVLPFIALYLAVAVA